MLFIFDMGGVVTTTAKLDSQIEEILGISHKEFLSYCGASCPEDASDPSKTNLFTMCSDGIIDCKEFWRIFSERSGIKVTTDWWHWLFHPQLNKKTVELIALLKEKGHRVICGTNTISSHYANHIERGDYTYFDQTYASCYMGVSKPDIKFWQLILQAENTRAEDAVFIDDRKDNVDAAASLGIKAFVFTDADSLKSDLQKAALI
ncbi:HAD family phosphatase [Treponema sp.]|uniref:HAD family hydrolase n=1 Tax=Treponema sp. TaxID=166 RepID=UPI0025F9F0DC|nr:HAD family phosphatase [Treponema sp.]MCR5218393.1 HAD family phosphatase [Treponema sp.]